MTDRLKLFLPSPASRLFPDVSDFLNSRGVAFRVKGRELFLQVDYLDVFFARGFDIPQAIEVGWGDLGITGLDAVAEAGAKVVPLRELGIRFSDVVIVSSVLDDVDELGPNDIVVTEYRRITYTYFREAQIRGLEYIYVTGAAETYGRVPDVSAIVTLATSGQTLQDNNLTVLDTVFRSQACLIANCRSLDGAADSVERFLRQLEGKTPE